MSSMGFAGIQTYAAKGALRTQIARAIAQELGDDFDKVPADKSAWIAERGGDPFRDVNLPFKHDYMAAAERVMGLCYAAGIDARSGETPKSGSTRRAKARSEGAAQND